MTKDEVRAEALRLGLPNAKKDESQEICFVPDGDYAGFVSAQALRRGRPLPVAGNIVDEQGTVLGRHDGAHHFTIGQHRGLGNLTTPRAKIEKLYVTPSIPRAAKCASDRRPPPERTDLAIRDLRWLSAPRTSFAASVQVAIAARRSAPTS